MSKTDNLYSFLSSNSEEWYLYSLDYITENTGFSRRRLIYLAESDYFQKKYNDNLCIFEHGGKIYAVLESRPGSWNLRER